MHLRDLLHGAQISFSADTEVLSPAESGLRDRVDLVIEEGRLGLYERNSRRILDIELCQQLSPALSVWLTEVRKVRWPLRKGSLRLRVGPLGQKGLWLDFANVDIKALLEEKSLLLQLQAQAFVEIGQKKKVPVLIDGVFKLKEAAPQVWFQTWIQDTPVDLFCSVGTFTQPSMRANRDLALTIETWLDHSGAKNILEFGSGIGNLSFPALGTNRFLTACEIDEGALKGFTKSLEALSKNPAYSDCGDRVRLLAGDFQNKNPQDFEKFDAVLVNPPRSGLKEFLGPLVNAQNKPQHFIYMSCFAETFVEDGKSLQKAGYKISELKIMDQFPQTTHYEILCLWTLSSLQ